MFASSEKTAIPGRLENKQIWGEHLPLEVSLEDNYIVRLQKRHKSLLLFHYPIHHKKNISLLEGTSMILIKPMLPNNEAKATGTWRRVFTISFFTCKPESNLKRKFFTLGV